jgi:cytosine/adenosine deaminase-related metal-dependent hydrolase
MKTEIRIASVFLLFLFWGEASAAQAQLPQAKLIITNALLMTMVPGQEKPFLGYIVVGNDEAIAAIGAGSPPSAISASTTYNAGGKWVIPGFISAHSHLWQSAYRGLAPNKELNGWLTVLYVDHAPKADAEAFYWFTLDGALDHLRHGVTGAFNFNYAPSDFGSGVGDQSFDQAQFRAETKSGIRFVHGFETGHVGPQWSADQALAYTRSFIDWTKTQPSSTRFLKTMINGSGAYAENADQVRAEARTMRELGIGNQQHYLETAADQSEERSKFSWFLESGILGPGLLWGHFVHPDRMILEQTAKFHVGVSWNPLSNGRLASGIADIPTYLKLGIHVGMGVDGEASADRADPFENMRTGLYAIRAKYENAAVLSPYQVLQMHTLGSAEVLGVADKLGSLAKGKLADLVVIDPSEFGHVFDPYASLIFVGGVENIDRIYVGGDLAVSHGAVAGQNVAQVRHEAESRVH